MEQPERRQTAAWAFLVTATLASLWAAGHLGAPMAVIAVSIGIAAIKVIVVLRRFMELGRLSLPLRLFFYGWSVCCALMILGVASITAIGT
jgi:Prokaryotic Cytochrome C oxidase subunit IV